MAAVLVVYLYVHFVCKFRLEIVDRKLFISMLIGRYCSVMAAYKKHLIQTNNKDLLNTVNFYADIETYCNIECSPQSEKKKDEQAALISRLVNYTLYACLFASS